MCNAYLERKKLWSEARQHDIYVVGINLKKNPTYISAVGTT